MSQKTCNTATFVLILEREEVIAAVETMLKTFGQWSQDDRDFVEYLMTRWTRLSLAINAAKKGKP